ncbi:MAG: dipeptidyl aminopeptidase/acylaminoacyl-peptidase family protein [Bacteroidetes bacterium HLUCCA01]|nr:MAG: dipeptidyl aminopeptidase/acylaminoacyl-peptidase family protein [Bacteroidetes bacterium HLUCCA01]
MLFDRLYRAALALTVVFVFMLASSLSAQNGLTPLDIAKIQNVSVTAISPDGQTIAYTLVVPADPLVENRRSSVHLYAYDVATGQSTPLVTDGNVGGVQFRPGHATISFTARRDGDNATALYEVPVTGGDPVRLHSHETSMRGYSWAADGNHILYMANEVLDLPESELPYQPILFEENIPNAKAFIQNVAREGHEPHMIDLPGSVYIAQFSPDRSKIALAIAPTPNVDDEIMFKQLHIVDYRTRALLNTIDNEGKISEIHWSPDGTQIAYRGGHDIHDPIDGRIMVVSAEGGTPVNILPEFLGKFEQLRWSDENTIHFLASQGVKTIFGSVAPNGANFNRIIDRPNAHLTRFTVADNGTIAFTGSTNQHPAEVFVYSDGFLTRGTNSNPWLEEKDLGRVEVVTYTARDGEFDIEGMLYYPQDYQEGQTYPLITVVHGGPEAHYSDGWLTGYSTPGHFGSAEGYFVFYPNYRGSTGRGIEFIYSSQADLSGKEFDDVVDGVDYLIERGLVDADRVGVTGGSYGGYATAWMSTYYSERFAAGVMFVGISNNISKWGTSDIPEELYLVHSRKRLWDDWMDKLERSPIYYVDRAQTPLLIMHGAEDTRVHPAQSLELFRHIKVRKPEVPLQLVLYPGEGHGNANSTARYDYTLRMINWFNTHLK